LLALFGDIRTSRVSIQKRGAQSLLKQLDGSADCWSRDAELTRRYPEAPPIRNQPERYQPVQDISIHG
jgi:hypothetical protein